MISSIGLLPKEFTCERLIDSNDLNFENQNLLGIDGVKERIKKDEITICTTYNEEEFSSLIFYVFNGKKIRLHHDIPIMYPVIDSCLFEKNNDTFVALATDDVHLQVFNVKMKNTLHPQLRISGHEMPILSICEYKNRVFTGDASNVVISWDLNKECASGSIKTDQKPNKILVTDKIVACGTKNLEFITGNKSTIMEHDGNIEQIRALDNYIIVSDGSGFVSTADVRKLKKFIHRKKVHNGSICGLDVINSQVITGSFDNKMKMLQLNLEELKVVEKEKCISALVACGFYEDMVFYGGRSAKPKFLKL